MLHATVKAIYVRRVKDRRFLILNFSTMSSDLVLGLGEKLAEAPAT
jgi:hypothetical protein